MKTALVYDPYLDTLGGGERFTLTFALALVAAGYRVEVAWGDQDELIRAKKRYGLDFSGIRINTKSFTIIKSGNLINRLFLTSHYSLTFWLSDGSIPFLASSKNLLHFQVPFTHLSTNDFLSRIKLSKIKTVIYNSNFTKNLLDPILKPSQSCVVYPPIDVVQFVSTNKKENIIVSVGRFDSPSHAKRQDVLINAFKILYSKNKNYKLVLAGGLYGDDSLLDHYRAIAGKLPISFVINPDFPTLKKLYSRARFYWHAAGYGVDDQVHPENVEHFGMTTVEAMASGCIPIVISKGGQKEIVINGENGYLVNTEKEIADTTNKLASSKKLVDMASKAVERANLFSNESFYQSVKKICDE